MRYYVRLYIVASFLCFVFIGYIMIDIFRGVIEDSILLSLVVFYCFMYYAVSLHIIKRYYRKVEKKRRNT
jgi:hypothetical protein